MNARIQVSPSIRARFPAPLARALSRRVGRAARRVGVDSTALGQLTVRVTDDADIAGLHLQFMGLSGPTDVLSFPAAPDDVDEAQALGDIVIAWDVAVAQSAARGAGVGAWFDELTDLSLHGLAHLLGHDHGTPPQAREMLRLERRLARAAALPPPQRPYGFGGRGTRR